MGGGQSQTEKKAAQITLDRNEDALEADEERAEELISLNKGETHLLKLSPFSTTIPSLALFQEWSSTSFFWESRIVERRPFSKCSRVCSTRIRQQVGPTR